MTFFQKGPADGQKLLLKRAAKFLRVTEEAGKWDALDQLEDTPRPAEKLHAYQIIGTPGSCHINMGRGRGGFYIVATYQFCEQQPTDEQMRDNKLWREWCFVQTGK